MERIGKRIDNEIPPNQAAYRNGGSTTKHVFSTKLIVERTITSSSETVYLKYHDMSKAFDSINRSILINDLSEILDNDETHLIKLLINVQLAVKYKSEFFKTDTGVPQGDYASANEFTFYLAKALQNDKNYEHDYMKTITIPAVHRILLNTITTNKRITTST